MSLLATPPSVGTSTRPYLIRALHEWCTENNFTPYIAVFVGAAVRVPTEYVKNNEIVLNVGYDATNGLKLGNELIEFKARFGGAAREIEVPVSHVIAIYARENGQGMAFPMPSDTAGSPANSVSEDASEPSAPARSTRLKLAKRSTKKPARHSPVSTDEASGDTPPPVSPSPSGPSLKRVK